MDGLLTTSRPIMCYNPPPKLFMCSQTKHNNIGNARKPIHERKIVDFGYLILVKNQLEILINDDKFDEGKSSYLISLHDGFLSNMSQHSFLY